MYESFYGLKEKPFTLLPDPEYLYLSPKHQRALTLLEYGMMNQAGFSVICGDTGAGKTTLIRRLLAELEDDTTVGLITNTHQSFGELLNWVLMAFGLDSEGKSKTQMHQMFVEFLVEQYARNKHTVLIVDEAQNMDANTLEELRMLSNINADKDQVLQVILAGQPALRDTLRRPELMQFAQRIAVDYYLESLNRDETLAYIQHRLEVAGTEHEIFTPAACDLVYKYSAGTPRLINLLCDTALVYGFAEQTKLIDAPLVEEVVREQHAHSIVPTFNVSDDEGRGHQSVAQASQHQVNEEPPSDETDKSVINNAQEEIETVIAELGQRARQVVSNFDSATRAVTEEVRESMHEKVAEAHSRGNADTSPGDAKVTPIKQDVHRDDDTRQSPPDHQPTRADDDVAGQSQGPTRDDGPAQAEKEGRAHQQSHRRHVHPDADQQEPVAEDDEVVFEAEDDGRGGNYSRGYNSHRSHYDDMYPIIQVDNNERKGNASYLVLGIAAGMFAASVVMVIAGYFMFYKGSSAVESSAAVQSSPTESAAMIEAKRQQDIERTRLEAVQKERDAALAMTRALERERDAALAAARAQEEMRAAERRAAEMMAQQERRTAEEVRRARALARKAEIAAAQARERERLAREQAEQAKIEAEKVKAAKEEALAAQQARQNRPQSQERPTAAPVDDGQTEPEPSVEVETSVVTETPESESTPVEDKAPTKFSANPCNSASAKFLSTCKK